MIPDIILIYFKKEAQEVPEILSNYLETNTKTIREIISMYFKNQIQELPEILST